jgi:hypothetical protein
MTRLPPATATDVFAVADALADAARAAILPHFRAAGLTADSKETARFDPVTIADRAAEDAMRALLALHRPQDAILGEERGRTAGTSGLTWVLDPIDGTRGFLAGHADLGGADRVDRCRWPCAWHHRPAPHWRTVHRRAGPGRPDRPARHHRLAHPPGAPLGRGDHLYHLSRGRQPGRRRRLSPSGRAVPAGALWHGLLCLWAGGGRAHRPGGRSRAATL